MIYEIGVTERARRMQRHKNLAPEASVDTVINTCGNTDHTAKCLMEGITGKREMKRENYVHKA
jgi:hypothetical protein